jgi:LysR family glycine cleavage system transcriptional activator
LHALRTLITVVRHGGVSRAAERLHLTQGAVSHQIRALQEALGLALFEKDGRRLLPTAALQAYVERLEAAFLEIETATQALLDSSATARLRISTTPSFAVHWLLPRLGDFIAANPMIDIGVESSSKLVSLNDGQVDVALRFGTGRYPGCHCELLMHDVVFPVCSPDYARRHRLADPPELGGVSFLCAQGEPWSWWFPAAGLVADEPARGLAFSDSSLMLQAAIAGQGLGLARRSVAGEALAAGTLVRPFSATARSPHAHYFVCRKDKLETPAVAAFRRWLTDRVAQYLSGEATNRAPH